jgi:phosphoheptose isomerase
MHSVEDHIKASIEAKERMLADVDLLTSLQDIVIALEHVYKNGKKVLIAGNGGSAAVSIKQYVKDILHLHFIRILQR